MALKLARWSQGLPWAAPGVLAVALLACTIRVDDRGEPSDPADPAPLINGGATVLVAPGARTVWRYSDRGEDMGGDWMSPAYDDSGADWSMGAAPFGYDGSELRTAIGPDPARKFTTTYFRARFEVADPGAFERLMLYLMRDDGAVVYLNGVEVFRSNLPDGAITAATPALQEVEGPDQSRYLSAKIKPTLLWPGANVIAAEIHQATSSASDFAFDLGLAGDNGITRGPYLQMGTPTSAIVHFQTDDEAALTLSYGLSPDALTSRYVENIPVREHVLHLRDLTPATAYFYALSVDDKVLAGGDSETTFTTSPLPGVGRPTRLWVLGDSGTANVNARRVRDAYLAFANGRHTDLWLMLGDNAYPAGTDSEYQAAVFDMYPMFLRNTFLWPTLGNHETNQVELIGNPVDVPYFRIFDLPANGEAGGVPTGTEKYYSFDYGNIHFISLDSMTSSRADSGAMLTWLKADLEVQPGRWLIAFWHHPPYSKGSHDSDEEPQLIQMRENVLPLLEQAGVDLVLSGHSHSYERSFLLDGHYGSSSSFRGLMKRSGGSGRSGESGPYRKDAGPHHGAVYVVAGASGQRTLGMPLNHPAMFVSFAELGSLVVDITDNRLEAHYLRDTGNLDDSFVIEKP